MTLHEFLDHTAAVSDRDIRPALALALKDEIPRSREGYSRFYRRVLDNLDEARGLVRSCRCGAPPVPAVRVANRRLRTPANWTPRFPSTAGGTSPPRWRPMTIMWRRDLVATASLARRRHTLELDLPAMCAVGTPARLGTATRRIHLRSVASSRVAFSNPTPGGGPSPWRPTPGAAGRTYTRATPMFTSWSC